MENPNLEMEKTGRRSTWTIVGGCLEDVITLESSLTPTDDDDNEDDELDTVVCRTPLTLHRPSPDSAPCEITIDFTHQHDIKQIYVRSSARVYEVYCSTTSPVDDSSNEYLCTVRCGVATTDNDDHQTHGTPSDTVDGWVDVNFNTLRFEATAEISDGDPVMSVTLRFLSIQTGDFVFIDELYVFADPLLSSDNPSSPKTSSGGALLSMFMPTLMQLSKSRMNTVQEQDTTSLAGETSTKPDVEHHSTANTLKTKALPTVMHNTSSFHQPNHLLQSQNPANTEAAFPCSKIEQILDDLVSRLSKIEAFCLRFEETMLKPIISMETRLERIEQQLDSSIKNLKSESCDESKSDSICIVANDCPATLKSELSKKGNCSPQESGLPNADALSLSLDNDSQPLPGLVISGPEFLSIDEEDEINSMEEVKDSPRVLKKPMSINDALASALAEFATSAITKHTEHTTKVEGPEIVSEAQRSGSTSPSFSSMPPAKQLECRELVEEAGKLPDLSTEKDYLTVVSCGKETIEDVNGQKGALCQGDFSDCSLDKTEDKGLSAGLGCTEFNNDAFVSDGALLKDVDFSVSFSGQGVPKACPAVVQDIMELPSAVRIDFSSTVLDVKFASLENLSGKSYLESLLGDMLDLECEVACIREEGVSCVNEQYDLVVVESIENEGSGDVKRVNNKLLSVDGYNSDLVVVESIENEGSGDVKGVNNKLLYVDDYNSEDMPSETEPHNSCYCSGQDTSASLI